jgi:hypothetical protein
VAIVVGSVAGFVVLSFVGFEIFWKLSTGRFYFIRCGGYQSI